MTPRVRQYLSEAAEGHGVTPEQILGARRLPRIVAARREVWSRLHADGFSMSRIGRWTNKHHTSVLHGLRATLEARA